MPAGLLPSAAVKGESAPGVSPLLVDVRLLLVCLHIVLPLHMGLCVQMPPSAFSGPLYSRVVTITVTQFFLRSQ